MKKLSVIMLLILLIAGVLAGCKKNTYEVYIRTDRISYDVSSSSVQGITISPELKTNDKNLEVQYYWSTTNGAFVGTTDKEIVNTGEPLVWSAISDKSKSAPSDATISLTVKEKKTGKTLGISNLTISGKGSVYTVKK